MARHYKFTKKKQSMRGLIAFAGALLSVAAFVFVLADSFDKHGKGSVYLGSLGVLALIISFATLLLSSFAVKEEETYKFIPYAGFILSAISFLLWIALYVMGFLL